MRLYLAHPFDSRIKIRAVERRCEEDTGLELFNPFYDAPGRTDIEIIDAGRAERYEKLNPNELVKRDLQGILGSDGLLGIIDGALSYGTIMEIVYAYKYGKLVYLIVTNGQGSHPWLQYHAETIFTSWEEFQNAYSAGRLFTPHRAESCNREKLGLDKLRQDGV